MHDLICKTGILLDEDARNTALYCTHSPQIPRGRAEYPENTAPSNTYNQWNSKNRRFHKIRKKTANPRHVRLNRRRVPLRHEIHLPKRFRKEEHVSGDSSC